jgi:hemoglobin/transferrin/lactoferrin receptor protein
MPISTYKDSCDTERYSMSPRPTRQSSSPSRMLSLLTAAILMAGSAQLSAATADGQPARNMGDYSFAIPQQSLVSALNAFAR